MISDLDVEATLSSGRTNNALYMSTIDDKSGLLAFISLMIDHFTYTRRTELQFDGERVLS